MDKQFVKNIQKLINSGRLDTDMSVLVVCGEEYDAEVFAGLGFKQVTVTNLDERHEGSWKTGAEWAREDVENLSCPDGAFDLVAVHSGLHHCRYPHKALCEMYRVAGVGVLVSEPCENQMVQIGRKLGVGQEYEIHAVAYHDLKMGGVSNTSIPNYVYRWTAGEILRTVCSYAPEYAHEIIAKNHIEVHWHDLKAKKKGGKLVLMLLLYPFLKAASLLVPGFGNILFTYIPKGKALHPWLRKGAGGVEPDREWFSARMTLGE